MTRSVRGTIAVVPDPDEAAETFAPVDSSLWSERSLLQRLLYQLTAQELVISAGRLEWLHNSDLEIRALVHELRLHEVRRAAETEMLNSRYGLTYDAPLRAIVAAAPEPWATLMADHLHALRDLQAAVERVAGHNAALLRRLRDGEPPTGGQRGGQRGDAQ